MVEHDQVALFLKLLKTCAACNFRLERRPENMATLAQLGMTTRDAHDRIVALTPADYAEGPKPRDTNPSQEAWVFGLNLQGVSVRERQVTETIECFECGRLVTPRVEERKETLPVRGEPTEVLARVAVCPECDADMSVEELDDATLVAAFNLYRQKHGLMAPEEMKRLRERYGLGVRPFSLLLGWGEITAHRYENGSLQDAAHEAALRLAEEPANIRVYLSANGHKLTSRQRARLETHLQAIEARDRGRAEDRDNRLVARETRAGYGNRLVPDVAISPGETIQELLEDRGIARADFAKMLGCSEKQVERLLSGDASLSHQMATDLERVLGVPAIMWENLEVMYRALLRRDRG